MKEFTKFKPCAKKMLISPILGTIWLASIFVGMYIFLQSFSKSVGDEVVPYYINQYYSSVVIIIVALGAAIELLSLMFKEYELQEDQVLIREGIIWKSNKSLPYHKLTDATLRQGPFERFFGFANISLQTAGSSNLEAMMIGIEDFDFIQSKIRGRIRESKEVSQSQPISEEIKLLKDILNTMKSIDSKLGKD